MKEQLRGSGHEGVEAIRTRIDRNDAEIVA
jgi:hypothetical protein